MDKKNIKIQREDSGSLGLNPSDAQIEDNATKENINVAGVLDYVNAEIRKARMDLRRQVRDEVKRLDNEVDKFRQEQERNKIGVIEALAIFVALFTFVSTNIVVFSKIEYLAGAIWFMVLMLICEMCLLSMFLIFLRKEQRNWLLWLVPFGFIICLAGLLSVTLNNPKLNSPLVQKEPPSVSPVVSPPQH